MLTFCEECGNIMTRNSRQRRRDGMFGLVDNKPINVIYNGFVAQDMLSYLPDRGLFLEDGTQITRNYVYAIDVSKRTLTLRLRNTRGIVPNGKANRRVA
jgi:hypothetical protein